MKLTTAFATLLAALSVGLVNANTPLSDAFVKGDLDINEGFEIAFASRPYVKPLKLYPTISGDTEHTTNCPLTPVFGTLANLKITNHAIPLPVSIPPASNTD